MYLLKQACGFPARPAWLVVQYGTDLETDGDGYSFFVSFLLPLRPTLSQYQQQVLWRHLSNAPSSPMRFDWDDTCRLVRQESPSSRRLVRAVRELEATTGHWHTFRLWRAPLIMVETATFSVHAGTCLHFSLNLLAAGYFAAQVGGVASVTIWPTGSPTMFHGCHSGIAMELPLELCEVARAPSPRVCVGTQTEYDEEADGLVSDFHSCCRV